MVRWVFREVIRAAAVGALERKVTKDLLRSKKRHLLNKKDHWVEKSHEFELL